MTRTINEIHEDLDMAQEYENEVYCQYRSECSLYGDAWPGAQIDVQKARQLVVKLQKELVNHPDYVLPEVAAMDYDDIPF